MEINYDGIKVTPKELRDLADELEREYDADVSKSVKENTKFMVRIIRQKSKYMEFWLFEDRKKMFDALPSIK
jgi:hypothetical protein